MERRKFIQAGVAASALVAMPSALADTPPVAAVPSTDAGSPRPHGNSVKRRFQLKYAPHLGMFRQHAGDDPVDQLNFMADEGFSAFEDNGMRDRDVAVQEAMATTMANRGLQMGVFVAHQIYWTEPNLTSGDPDLRAEFLSYIRASVDVAKRVNANMTVFDALDSRNDPQRRQPRSERLPEDTLTSKT